MNAGSSSRKDFATGLTLSVLYVRPVIPNHFRATTGCPSSAPPKLCRAMPKLCRRASSQASIEGASHSRHAAWHRARASPTSAFSTHTNPLRRKNSALASVPAGAQSCSVSGGLGRMVSWSWWM